MLIQFPDFSLEHHLSLTKENGIFFIQRKYTYLYYNYLGTDYSNSEQNILNLNIKKLLLVFVSFAFCVSLSYRYGIIKLTTGMFYSRVFAFLTLQWSYLLPHFHPNFLGFLFFHPRNPSHYYSPFSGLDHFQIYETFIGVNYVDRLTV